MSLETTSMKSLARYALLAALSCTAMHAPSRAEQLTPEQKTEVESIIRDYLLKNPEILRDVSEALQAKEQAAEETARKEGLKQSAAQVFRHAGDPVLGNPAGDITLVEFMDYNCGWCKRSVDEISGLVAKDKNIRIVIKEFPIFGAGSNYAAKAALAAARQGKYWELHQALFKQEGQVTEEVVDAVAAEVGLDVVKLKQDMEDAAITETLTLNAELGRQLAINGTPAFIVDETFFPGYVPARSLEEAISKAREQGGCKIC
jgi:protein-disulfide isomerase